MGLYESIKDVAKLVQQADNIPLYSQLIDLCSQALEQQEEISNLKQEIRELKNHVEISDRIQRHEQPYITLKDEDHAICYCARCWDVDSKLVQVRCDYYSGKYYCTNCENIGIYDQKQYEDSISKNRVSTPVLRGVDKF